MRLVFAALSVLGVAAANPLSSRESQAPPPPGDALLTKVYQFPNGTSIENIAVRSNGNLLLSLIAPAAEIWELNPRTKQAKKVATFPSPATGAMSLTETEEDVFAVPVGAFDPVDGAVVEGSWGVWSVDFRQKQTRGLRPSRFHRATTSKPKVKKILDWPSAGFLNGATTLPAPNERIVLLSDFSNGLIYALNAHTAEWNIAIDNAALKPNAYAPYPFGVNGVRYHEGYIYHSNTLNTPLLARTPIDLTNGSAIGPFEVIASKPQYPTNDGLNADDFAISEDGTVWLATASNTLVRIGSDGEQTVIAGGADSPVLLGCTSAAFGRGKGDRGVLYVVTDGGVRAPEGLERVGGGVWAIDTGKLGV